METVKTVGPDFGTFAQIIATLFVALAVAARDHRSEHMGRRGSFLGLAAYSALAIAGAVLAVDGVALRGEDLTILGGEKLWGQINVLVILYMAALVVNAIYFSHRQSDRDETPSERNSR